MSQLYFAYGSNLWLEQMHQRCPECIRVGIGILKRRLWIISKRGYANIIESENDEVHGIIYNISPADEAGLDRKRIWTFCRMTKI
jgi:gamma-glutamylcyclotransferase